MTFWCELRCDFHLKGCLSEKAWPRPRFVVTRSAAMTAWHELRTEGQALVRTEGQAASWKITSDGTVSCPNCRKDK